MWGHPLMMSKILGGLFDSFLPPVMLTLLNGWPLCTVPASMQIIELGWLISFYFTIMKISVIDSYAFNLAGVTNP